MAGGRRGRGIIPRRNESKWLGWQEEGDGGRGRNGNSKERYECHGEGDCGKRYVRRTETMGKGRNVRRNRRHEMMHKREGWNEEGEDWKDRVVRGRR